MEEKAENGSVEENPVETILEDGTIHKTLLVAGQGGEPPKPGEAALVSYVGPSEQDPSFRFVLGRDNSRPGWSQAVCTMQRGEKAKFVFQAPSAEPEAYEIELLSWNIQEYITDDGAVTKTILKQGGGGYDTPGRMSLCFVSYFLKNSEGICVVGTENVEIMDTVTLDLSSSEVFEGVVETLLKMKKGERSFVKIGPGYGAREGEGVGQSLEGEIELIDFGESPRTLTMSGAEKLAHGNKLKDLGNSHMKAGGVRRARGFYEDACKVFRTRDEAAESKADVDRLLCHCKANLSLCALKQEDFERAVTMATEALELDPHNVKALFRRAQACFLLRDYELALEDLKQVVQEEGKTSATVSKLLNEVKQAKAREHLAEKKLFGGMFEKISLVADHELPAEARKSTEKQRDKTKAVSLIPNNPLRLAVLIGVFAVVLGVIVFFFRSSSSEQPTTTISTT